MSKKSSYMNVKNIISESFIDKLVRSLIPKSVQQKITSAYLKKNKEELYKLEKELEKGVENSNKIASKFENQFKKTFGKKIKIKKRSIKDYIDIK